MGIYFLYILGLMPSIVWLAFYLRKDKNPEPNRIVLKVFFLGILAGFFAIFIQMAFRGIITGLPAAIFLALDIFIGAGLIEETSKYFFVRTGSFRDRALDEPTDIMLYMIIGALGFAALENVLYLSQKVLTQENFVLLNNLHTLMPARITLEFLGWRFISATFLHALVAGVFGYFIALSFCQTKHRKIYFATGLFLAAAFHGIYDWSIMAVENALIPIALLICLGSFVSYGFTRLKKLKNTCNV